MQTPIGTPGQRGEKHRLTIADGGMRKFTVPSRRSHGGRSVERSSFPSRARPEANRPASAP